MRVYGNEYRTTVVCIDSYEAQVFCGRFYNPCLAEGKSFDSLMQFILEMEEMLDGMQFPQAFRAARSFSPPPQFLSSPASLEEEKGQLATFAVRILFRQNASWQGSVTWIEGGREECFRSVMELVLLMNSALV